MTLRCIKNVCETYCKDCYLQKDLPTSHLWEIYGWCTKFARVTEVSQILGSHFTAPFSASLQIRIQNLVEHHNGSFFPKILHDFFKLLTLFANKAHRTFPVSWLYPTISSTSMNHEKLLGNWSMISENIKREHLSSEAFVSM